MTTMIQLSDEQIERRNTFCGCNLENVVKYVSIHGVISTLLLPLTVQVIGGQYGVLMISHSRTKKCPDEVLTLTDMHVVLEVFLISLLLVGHSVGFIGVFQKWSAGLVLNLLFRIGEIFLSFYWLMSVFTDNIKSHTMSQFSLGWYCFFSFFVQFMSLNIIVLWISAPVKKKIKKD
ncbi:hypothetical protein HCN44_000160 [Aphidius gifuensis]|uniref:Uncharacterized protein n=1 Tax=Aphidius gifuensis TaxID=684658 RepID=A0A834XRE8_APHGI|nr:uncharacterized protein LOC122855271 [Aphidius gifuensis]KAF7990355.1 hypothetical protein HCN44_000160 [Aphidius gifuensis]